MKDLSNNMTKYKPVECPDKIWTTFTSSFNEIIKGNDGINKFPDSFFFGMILMTVWKFVFLKSTLCFSSIMTILYALI